MSSDLDVKLIGLKKGERLRLIVRFRTVQALLKLYKQVRDKGAFALPLKAARPPVEKIPILFRTKRKGEEFPAAIVSWQEKGIVLEPTIDLHDFKELTSSLVAQLSNETSRFVAVSQPTPETEQAGSGADQKRVEDQVVQTPEQPSAVAAPVDHRRVSDSHRQVSFTPQASIAAASEVKPDAGRGVPPVRTHDTGVSGSHSASRPAADQQHGVIHTDESDWVPRQSEPSLFAADSGGFSKVGFGIPRGAFRFLDDLEIAPEPLSAGEGRGRDALTALQHARIEGKQVVLIADSPSEGLRWYFFTEGSRVLSAYQTPPSIQTSLSVLLARQGLLDTSAAEQVLQDAAARGVPEEIAIEALGEVSPEMLVKASTARAKLLGERLRAQRGILYKVHVLRRPIRFRPKATRAKTGQFRSHLSKYDRMSWAEMDERAESRLSAYPSFTGSPELLRGKLGLDDKGRQFVSHCLNGRYTVRDLPKVSSLSRPKTFAVLFALDDSGLIKWEQRERAVTLQYKTAEIIEEQHEKIGSVDDFEFLGVHWTATGPEIEAAVERIREEFAPGNLPKLNDSTMRQTREIVREAGRIKNTLSTVEARRSYRTHILEPFAVEQACELILSNFDMAMYRDQQSELKKLMARLIELDPKAALEARERLRAGQRGRPRKKS